MWCVPSGPQDARHRVRTVSLAWVLATAAVAGQVVADETGGERFVLERAYRDALLQWSSGESGSAAAAVAAYSYAQERAGSRAHGGSLASEGAGLLKADSEGEILLRAQPRREIHCALRPELHTVELLERSSPDHLLALSVFHLEVHLDQMSREPRPWLEEMNRERFTELLERYGRFAERQAEAGQGMRRLHHLFQAWMVAGTSQVALGWRLPMQRGVEAFDHALTIIPGALEARYWTVLVHEKLDRYDLATEGLRSLADDFPASAEIRLRLALGLRRQGRGEAAVAALRELLEGAGARRARILAYQELASLLAAQSEGWSEAMSVLRRGIEDFPENQRLRIELSYLLADRALGGDAPPEEAAVLLAESERLVDVVLEGALSSGGARRRGVRGSPRLRYELPDPALVGPPMEQAAESVIEWRRQLHEGVRELAPNELTRARCR